MSSRSGGSALSLLRWIGGWSLLLASGLQAQSTSPLPSYGPYNARALADGLGLVKPMQAHEPMARGGAGWSLSLWVKSDEAGTTALLAGVGSPLETFPRYLGLREGKPFFWTGAGHFIDTPAAISAGSWHSIAVSVEGAEAHLFVDGMEVAHDALAVGPATPVLQLAPVEAPGIGYHHFGGLLALVSLSHGLDAGSMTHPPANLDALVFEDASKAWPVQVRQQAGYRAPQDPATLPHSAAPPQSPHAVPEQSGEDHVHQDGRSLTLRHGWRMADRTTVHAEGAQISSPGFDASRWYSATVPGTVLTTLIDRGIYPDPDYGLSNMAIPESLSRQSFWFRTRFPAPSSMRQGHPTLAFLGINYHATIWLNGKLLGEMKGAFAPESFDVGGLLITGQNTLAVLIDPPPHPGIAHEQSLAAGAGENGGILALDGPTFAATEGWDWIPGIRDRNMGIWQDVVLSEGGAVSVESPQVNATLPLPDTGRAAVTLKVPLVNHASTPVRGVLEVAFEGVSLHKAVTVPPGETTVTLTPAEFASLNVVHPRLWWPNGYGSPELYHLTSTFRVGRVVSDARQTRFGIREITYELSLLDASGHLRRVEIDPALAALRGERLVDESHEGIRETPLGWVASLLRTAEYSPAVRALSDVATQPSLVIRVNGVRIACRGGSSGMEDMRKRVSRERLEPFFRLHREAHMNIIRNWMGQNTEEVFFDLADEYGLLVWNDFWDSTQDYNLEPDDSALFLRNARETIRRFQSHPSLAVWCGRNEGVPTPTLNRGLEELIATYDGTRFYSASSNRVNLHDSGPYKYQDPELYFTTLARGFAVEIGLPSPPTLEAYQSFLPKEDQWPISDDWAYHDWHQGSNGDMALFLQAMNDAFGPAADLADFDRKAQMLNYVGHRAVFEGFNAHLWAPNSGRMLWMTQPAWPSMQWQIFSHDYDTHASYFGAMKANESIHVQMNLPEHDIVVVNNTTRFLPKLTIRARVFDAKSNLLFERTAMIDAPANAVRAGLALPLHEALAGTPVVFIRLDLADESGKLLSNNFYWLAAQNSGYRALNGLPSIGLQTSATTRKEGAEQHLSVTLVNRSATVVLAAKLTLLAEEGGARILPAYYSDNYISLLPGEERVVEILYPAAASQTQAVVALRGWNVHPSNVHLQAR